MQGGLSHTAHPGEQAEASAKRAEQAGTAAEARAQRAEQRLTEAEQQLQEQRGAARQLQQRVTSLETQMQAAAQRLVRVCCSHGWEPPVRYLRACVQHHHLLC